MTQVEWFLDHFYELLSLIFSLIQISIAIHQAGLV
jgi:hypothetical protein